MTSFTLGLDDELAARLEERAAQAGVSPEEMARRMIAERLVAHVDEPGADRDPSFDFIGIGSSDVLRGSDVDKLLAEGFGQFRS
ncbi:MAG: ribbon-helix-helix domain-containing protein [Actinomycetota bacterium]|nr:ribbon-helix-helix domain-containing protein [Actinomycetota bacterium]